MGTDLHTDILPETALIGICIPKNHVKIIPDHVTILS